MVVAFVSGKTHVLARHTSSQGTPLFIPCRVVIKDTHQECHCQPCPMTSSSTKGVHVGKAKSVRVAARADVHVIKATSVDVAESRSFCSHRADVGVVVG
jgi:hypothetical protein